MTGFRGWNETERVVDPLTPETLRPMLLGASEFVVVDNPSWGAGSTARATRTDAERWVIEITAEATESLRATNVNSDAAFDILRSWAAGDEWWRDAFSWSPLDD